MPCFNDTQSGTISMIEGVSGRILMIDSSTKRYVRRLEHSAQALLPATSNNPKSCCLQLSVPSIEDEVPSSFLGNSAEGSITLEFEPDLALRISRSH